MKNDLLLIVNEEPWPLLGRVELYRILGPSFQPVLVRRIDEPRPYGESSEFGATSLLTKDWAFVADPRGRVGIYTVGRVHVYSLSEAGLDFSTMIDSPLKTGEDRFGTALAYDDVSQCLFVSAPNQHKLEPELVHNVGSVYSYCYQNGQWNQVDRQYAPSGHSNTGFGYVLAVGGGRLSITAVAEDEPWEDAGAVYIYDVTLGVLDLKYRVANPGPPTSYIGEQPLVYNRSFGMDVFLSTDEMFATARLQWSDGNRSWTRISGFHVGSAPSVLISNCPVMDMTGEEEILTDLNWTGAELFGMSSAGTNTSEVNRITGWSRATGDCSLVRFGEYRPPTESNLQDLTTGENILAVLHTQEPVISILVRSSGVIRHEEERVRSAAAVVFPSPARDVVNIISPLDRHGMASIQVVNLLGQMVSSWRVRGDPLGESRTQQDIRSLKAGLYYLRFLVGTTRITQPIVVAR
jgi:hypothetical protein